MYLDKAIELEVNIDKTYIQKAIALNKLGEYDEAINSAQMSIMINKNNDSA
jgi:tetratricopeptide (TPR) repeat protein